MEPAGSNQISLLFLDTDLEFGRTLRITDVPGEATIGDIKKIVRKHCKLLPDSPFSILKKPNQPISEDELATPYTTLCYGTSDRLLRVTAVFDHRCKNCSPYSNTCSFPRPVALPKPTPPQPISEKPETSTIGILTWECTPGLRISIENLSSNTLVVDFFKKFQKATQDKIDASTSLTSEEKEHLKERSKLLNPSLHAFLRGEHQVIVFEQTFDNYFKYRKQIMDHGRLMLRTPKELAPVLPRRLDCSDIPKLEEEAAAAEL